LHWLRRRIRCPLAEHALVAKFAFTGSEATGKRLYTAAANGLKKVSLELGGKSANIVFKDADIDNAVKGVISGIFAACGQTCVAGSRLLVQRNLHDEIVDKLAALAKVAKLGDPMLPATQVGPVTNHPQWEKILDYLDVARQKGAEAVIGGKRPVEQELQTGWFVGPTIFTGA
jgi:acyl-CoA reductase-like NAD-dependent aldehyde dehydrogenase